MADVRFDTSELTQLLRQRRVAVLGFGAQGRAQALNLRDSKARVKVALREQSGHIADARALGLEVVTMSQAAEWADTFLFCLPDEIHPQIYATYLKDALKPGDALVFAHGLTMRWRTIEPPLDVDVVMVAPKGPGIQVRTYFEAGKGLTNVVGVDQDATGHARELAYALALGIGGEGSQVVESTFEEEAITDLFGEQAVLCGGVLDLMRAGFETLVERGVEPALAYNECIQEMKLIIDLIAEHGFAHTYDVISTTAEYGGYRAGSRLVTDETRAQMRALMDDIASGAFAREWVADAEAGYPRYKELKARNAEAVRAIDEAGEEARALFKRSL